MQNPFQGDLPQSDRVVVNVLSGEIMRDGAAVAVTSQQRAIVMALALHPRGLSSERLFDLLYADDGPARANAAVRVHIYRLRRRIGLDFIATHEALYVLGGRISVCLPDETALRRTQKNLGNLTLDEIESLRLYARSLRSPASVGLEYYEWYVGFVARCQHTGRNLALAISRELAARAHHLEAIQIATELTQEDSCDEEAWEEVIRCHLSQGRRPAAVRGFRSLCTALKKDLGIPPSTNLLKLML